MSYPTLFGQFIGLALIALLVYLVYRLFRLVTRWMHASIDRNHAAALHDLAELHRSGQLSDEEFAEYRRRLTG